MIITSQGFGHFREGLNNQDFGIETPRMLLVLDGCSGAKYSEAGVRLFAQLFSRKEDFDSVEKFEENVKSVFDDMIAMGAKYYKTPEELENDFIMENLLFTIIACFQTEKEYIVKLFGDGYIATRNKQGSISYMKFYYGSQPPYFAYRYCDECGGEFKSYNFKTIHFDKSIFPKIAIATDGIMPIAKGDIGGVDAYLLDSNQAYAQLLIKSNNKYFEDDVTIATFDQQSIIPIVQKDVAITATDDSKVTQTQEEGVTVVQISDNEAKGGNISVGTAKLNTTIEMQGGTQ